jgi:V/A-type H+-transporting ATPase subunit A
VTEQSHAAGRVVRVAGPVVAAEGLGGIRVHDVVEVGELGLVGEVIQLSGEVTVIQVYEDSSGVRVGEPVRDTGQPLVAHLGPGLLGRVYDGLQRPLEKLAGMMGNFLMRGVSASPLPEEVAWSFTPSAVCGEWVGPGDILGFVAETQTIRHLIMVPPDVRGRVAEVREGDRRLNEVVAVVEVEGDRTGARREIGLAQRWPVRVPRPFQARLDPREPLITGTRVMDALFPVAKGGTAIIPGGFGTGKTVAEHSLARWADADIVVYVGCGERGNEMTEVLEEFPNLEDPRTGNLLIDRTVLIANTSNMPVAAREASIYTGITIAEYYRDMGYDVLVLADSTSRWGEALREISGRLEEMPGEEGYPAYLAARLSNFYERAGRVTCLGRDPTGADGSSRTGSVTVIGAVSPPGGDFSEPMTQNSMRVAGAFWALDYDLSRRRHFPSISWTRSYSLYDFQDWYDGRLGPEWNSLTRQAMALLQREVELMEIVQLVGPDALAEAERAVLSVARMLREDFLQQSAYHAVDRFCPMEKSYWILKSIMDFHQNTQEAIEAGVTLDQVAALPVVAEIARMKELAPKEAEEEIRGVAQRVRANFAKVRGREHD